MRSHPPSLLKILGRTLREDCEVDPDTRLLVAVSGGADSTALLHVLSLHNPAFQLLAVGVDHGLRRDAASELRQAAEFATGLGIEFVTKSVELAPGGNLQARAREARYAALESVRRERGFDLIVTAHHADDRAETILMRLLSGASPAGLAVLPVLDGLRLRPLIRARKSDVLLHLRRHGIAHAEDPSNRNPRFLRARVRHELVPLLEELSPAIVEHLNALSNDLAADPLPPILDADGVPVALNRAHREQLRRALRNRSAAARVLLPGNRVVVFDRRTGQPCVVSAAPPPKAAAEVTSACAANMPSEGAKNPKSG